MDKTINQHKNIRKFLFGLCFIAFANCYSLRAETVSVSLHELQSALDTADQDSDEVSRELLNRINEALNQAEIGFSNGEVLYQSSDSNITVEGGCNHTEIINISTELQLGSDTSLSLTLESLYEPIVVAVDVQADLNSVGRARNTVGIRLGDCRNLARDSFDFEADGSAGFSLSASVHLNPVWNNNTVLSLSPELRLDGELDYFSSNVNVDDTVLASLLESYIEDEIDETFTNSRLSSELQGFEKLANDRIAESLTDGRIDIELPEANDEQILALYRLLQPDARFPITLDMIRTHRRELLASLLFGEPTSPNAILADAVLCESASSFLSSAVTTPIYSGSPAQCDRVIDPGSVSGQTFFGQTWTDASCTKPIDYQPTSVSTYCDAALDPERLGNAASFPDQLKKWTHSPGSRLDISALGLEGLTQPFLRRFNYKQVETPRGTCELEMRVYSLGASSESQKPLLAFHGGSWQHRASGFIGIETMATHFANSGFTVFAPFYRLIGETDGNIACNDASLADIQEDINDAMDWVQERESEFGLVGKPTVFGQSAGGHLALSLATTRSDEIRRAVLFYAPTDFTDFAQQIKTGAYTNPAGLKILEAVTGSNIDTLDLSSPLVVENSFPALIAASETTIPPMFILHGEMDSLLPYRQAVRLCNALSGSSDFNDGAASLIPTIDGFVSKTQCGSDGSQLHLIAEGEHALDLCLAPGLCLAGSEQSADELAQSMRSMLQWSQAETVALNNSGTGSSFTGSTYWQVLLLLLLMRLWRTRGFYHSELTMKEYPHR